MCQCAMALFLMQATKMKESARGVFTKFLEPDDAAFSRIVMDYRVRPA